MFAAFVKYANLVDFEMIGVGGLVDLLVAVVMLSSSDVQGSKALRLFVRAVDLHFGVMFVRLRVSFLKYPHLQ